MYSSLWSSMLIYFYIVEFVFLRFIFMAMKLRYVFENFFFSLQVIICANSLIKNLNCYFAKFSNSFFFKKKWIFSLACGLGDDNYLEISSPEKVSISVSGDVQQKEKKKKICSSPSQGWRRPAAPRAFNSSSPPLKFRPMPHTCIFLTNHQISLLVW